LLAKESVSADPRVFTFELPDNKPLGLSTCACLLLQGGQDDKGEAFVRPYTPVSTNAMVGKFQLMVKIYPDGKMSQLLDTMEVGQSVNAKHIPFNVKIQYPFNKAHIGMLVGGTGITPMIQALHAVLGSPGDSTRVTMLYGSRYSDSILAQEALDDWQQAFPDRLKVVHVLSHEPEGSAWEGARGHIDKTLIAEHMPKPGEDGMVFVCGPPPMYAAICGARGEPELTGTLAELGYCNEEVFKF
jgi:cytochrome-b5 reductase